jgi:hypothetical protein
MPAGPRDPVVSLTFFRPSCAMLNLSNRTAGAVRALQRMAAGMATAAPRIGDTKVPMSLLEKGAFINYQRIEDNLVIVRERFILLLSRRPLSAHDVSQAASPLDLVGKDSVRPSRRPAWARYRARHQLLETPSRRKFLFLYTRF